MECAAPPGAVHEPPACGVPVRRVKRSVVSEEEHVVSVPLVPALGCRFSVTVTVATALAHGAVPDTSTAGL